MRVLRNTAQRGNRDGFDGFGGSVVMAVLVHKVRNNMHIRQNALSVRTLFRLYIFAMCPCGGLLLLQKVHATDIQRRNNPKMHFSYVHVTVLHWELRNIYHHHPESKKQNLQRQTLAPSTPTVDMEMLSKLGNHIYHSDSLACQGHF